MKRSDAEGGLSIAILARWLGFPHGMAESNRVRLLSRSLVERGHRVLVLSTGVSERPPVIENSKPRGTYEGVAFEYTTGLTVRPDSFVLRRAADVVGWTRAAAILARLKARGQVDCVYLWWHGMEREPSRAIVLAGLRLLRIPVAIELNELPWQVRGQTGVTASHLRAVDGVVAISRWLAAWAHEEAGRIGRTIPVVEVPIVVDVDEFPPSPYPLQGPPTVLLAAAPQYRDTILFTLEAMETAWRDQPETRLVITGVHSTSPEGRRLLESLEALGLDDRVEIAGYVSRERLLELYAGARALLIPLFPDDDSAARFPTKIGEYLAAGRPVVTTRVGEVARYLVDGMTAYIAEPGDATAYGEKIRDALADPAAAAQVGAAGRELAERHFSFRSAGETLDELFRLLSAPRSGRRSPPS